MFKKKFYFIVFEGTEGTGKSFQKKKFKAIKTREPGGSSTAESIRKLIFNKKSNKFDKLTDFYLMLAARNEHYKNTILGAKKKKLIVISDRFSDSTLAYQVYGNKINKEVNLINKKYILNNFKPDLTIVLKSKSEIIKKRLKKRNKLNKYDKLKEKFHLRIQNFFIKLSKNKNDYFLFDSSDNDNLLEKKIFSLVIKKLIN